MIYHKVNIQIIFILIKKGLPNKYKVVWMFISEFYINGNLQCVFFEV